jgi:hypothetical protein
MSYLLTECDDCEGEGQIYHLACEEPCEHDRYCRKCGATGQQIEREPGFIGAMLLAEGSAYRTRREAKVTREEEDEGSCYMTSSCGHWWLTGFGAPK